MAKSPDAFRTISEAAEEVGAPQHVLRFWETKFDFVKPMKRAGGRRFYRAQDVVVLKAVRRLLHDEGLTIRGVQRLHKERGLGRLSAYGEPSVKLDIDAAAVEVDGGAHADTSALAAILAELETAKRRLEAVLRV